MFRNKTDKYESHLCTERYLQTNILYRCLLLFHAKTPGRIRIETGTDIAHSLMTSNLQRQSIR